MPKQSELPGVGRKEIPEIEDAAEKLRDVRTKRLALAKKEEELQQELVDLLKVHKIKKYIYQADDGDGGEVTLDAIRERPDERGFVRRHKEPKPEDNGEGDAEEKE